MSIMSMGMMGCTVQQQKSTTPSAGTVRIVMPHCLKRQNLAARVRTLATARYAFAVGLCTLHALAEWIIMPRN